MTRYFAIALLLAGCSNPAAPADAHVPPTDGAPLVQCTSDVDCSGGSCEPFGSFPFRFCRWDRALDAGMLPILPDASWTPEDAGSDAGPPDAPVCAPDAGSGRWNGSAGCADLLPVQADVDASSCGITITASMRCSDATYSTSSSSAPWPPGAGLELEWCGRTWSCTAALADPYFRLSCLGCTLTFVRAR